MAEYQRTDDKAELIAQIARSRAQFSRSLAGLRHDLDIGARLKSSISHHKTAWIGSAGIAGWVLSRLPSRKKKVIVREGEKEGGKIKHIAEAGMLLSILKMLFTLFRPFIMSFATRKISDFAAKNNRWQK